MPKAVISIEADDESSLPLDFAQRHGHEADCCCCCDHVGKLIVVCERPQRPGQPRKLWCVLGPYWSMMLFCTTPLIAVPCAFTILFISTRVPVALTVVFSLASAFVLGALWKTATTDPGLVIQRDEEPPRNADSKVRWAWDDRTKTWRPTSARCAEPAGTFVLFCISSKPWIRVSRAGLPDLLIVADVSPALAHPQGMRTSAACWSTGTTTPAPGPGPPSGLGTSPTSTPLP